jgi:hypothetical protein
MPVKSCDARLPAMLVSLDESSSHPVDLGASKDLERAFEDEFRNVKTSGKGSKFLS